MSIELYESVDFVANFIVKVDENSVTLVHHSAKIVQVDALVRSEAAAENTRVFE